MALGIGGILGARWSAQLLTRLSDHRLLASVGVLLIGEAFLSGEPRALIPRDAITLVVSA